MYFRYWNNSLYEVDDLVQDGWGSEPTQTLDKLQKNESRFDQFVNITMGTNTMLHLHFLASWESFAAWRAAQEVGSRLTVYHWKMGPANDGSCGESTFGLFTKQGSFVCDTSGLVQLSA